MKKLDELKINPEKVLTNEDLINLRGGEEELYYCSFYTLFGGPFYGQGWGSNCREAEIRLCTQQLDVLYGFCNCSYGTFYCHEILP